MLKVPLYYLMLSHAGMHKDMPYCFTSTLSKAQNCTAEAMFPVQCTAFSECMHMSIYAACHLAAVVMGDHVQDACRLSASHERQPG